MTFQLVLLVVLLGFSAFFSGSETALFALTRHELSRFGHDRRASCRLVADLMRHPRRLLLTLMIGNVTVNMFIFAASLALFRSLAGEASALAPILGLISPILVTLFGEILPKGTAIVLRTRVAARVAPVVRLFQVMLTPFSLLLNTLLVEPMTRLLVGSRQPDEYVTVEELGELIEMSGRHRIIDADENAMLGEIVQLGELRVRDIMVPRVDIVAFEVHDDPDELRRIMRERRLTKLPVYDESIDRITGLVYAKDLFLDPDRPLGSMMRPIRFVPELLTLTQLLAEFRRTGTQLAAVVDEYGGVVGLVTVEDVAEQIVGELTLPGEPSDQASWGKLADRRYRVSGGVSIRDWSEQFQVRGRDEGATTLAGLMLARLGRIPAVGDRVRMGNLLLTVESLRGRRIEWILVELANGDHLPDAETAPAGNEASGDDKASASAGGPGEEA